MLKKGAIILFIIPFAVFAGKLDRIKRAIEDSDFTKAFELLQKAAEKEPFNPGLSYYKAFLYQTNTFQQYHLDSARLAVNKSLADFEKADKKMIEELSEDGIDQELATSLQAEIRDNQFLELLSNLSLETLNVFRSKYTPSIYDPVLDFKRDSIIFLGLKNNPNQENLRSFITNYSTSIFVPEAREILDQLNYFELRKNGRLTDHYQFLILYPRTKFRSQVEEYILHFSTLDHAPESYLSFIEMSQTKSLTKKAADLLYYLPKQRANAIAKHPKKDSMHRISNVTDWRLFPVMDRDQFGFMTQGGKLLIDYQFSAIHADDKCAIIGDDWIFVEKKGEGLIIDKLGNILLKDVDQYTDLTDGLALISKNGQKYLYHKSGFKILEEAVEDAQVLENRWIKVTRNGLSELISFLGLPITETKYNDIYLSGSFWVFEKRGLLAVYTEKLIAEELHKKGLSLEFKFEDIEIVRDSMFIGFRGTRECLLDHEINFLIPWDEHTIYPDESGWYLKSEKGYQLYNGLDDDIIDRYFSQLESNDGWLALKTLEDWMLLPRKKEVLPSRGYDSLKLINDFIVYTERNEEKNIIFNDGSLLTVDSDVQLNTFSNSPCLSVRDQKNVTVYDKNGQLIISGDFDQVSFLNDSLLKVETKNKQGLMNLKGEFLLRPTFDLLDQQDEMIFLLKEGKIGCFDLASKVVFLPKYESRLEKIGEHYAAKLNGKYGLFDLEEQSILDFQYDEIHFWDDSTFRVKEDHLYDFINYDGESVLTKVELMSLVIPTQDNEIWKFVKDGKYGLLSTKDGIILDSEFTDIFNIGTLEDPLFFADQHLSKAGFHVVSYVDLNGNLVFSKAYSKTEFDKIFCED